MIAGKTSIKLSEKEFTRFSKFIYEECGINLNIGKKALLENRLQKRLQQLGVESFGAYYDYIMTPKGQMDELVLMIDAVATNKTDFFREPIHFELLEKEIVPAWTGLDHQNIFKVWSAGCSTGEEPYTIAMVLEELSIRYGFNYRITATDISTKVLEKAINAVYPDRAVSEIPLALRKSYLLRSRHAETPTVRICRELRSKIQFKRMNLMGNFMEVDGDFNVIFCRNVLIYFDRVTQEKVVKKLLNKLRPGGYLMIGHSESIYHMDLPLTQLRPTVFQKD